MKKLKLGMMSLLLTSLILADGPVLKTGQTLSYDVYGNVVTDNSIKDDGFYQTGKARKYSHIGSSVVLDHATGLMWQDYYSDEVSYIKSDTWEEASVYCVNFALDGAGWRMPNIKELESIVNYGVYDSSVTSGVFSRIDSWKYWSSTSLADDDDFAWNVGFYTGYSHFDTKVDDYYVRCVKGGLLESSNFTRNNQTKIVTDNLNALQWQDDTIVTTTTRTWSGAIDYCENTLELGGFDDWRLPNENELLSIADRSRYNPAIDDTIFANTNSWFYWSSTTDAYRTTSALLVSFAYGSSLYVHKRNDQHYVRCVRGGKLKTSTFLPSVIMYLFN